MKKNKNNKLHFNKKFCNKYNLINDMNNIIKIKIK